MGPRSGSSAWEINDPSEVKLNVWYALTINPCDKYQFINHKNRVNEFYKQNKMILYNFIPVDIVWDLNQEICKSGRLHFHGRIKFASFTEVSDFFTNMMKLRQYSNLKFKNIDDNERWFEYCLKQSHMATYRMISNKRPFEIDIPLNKSALKYFGPLLKTLEDSSADFLK